jgi:diadenosine tetraphosphate (Ap4A) HIT family hydrolase
MVDAYQHGIDEMKKGNCDGFNIGLNVGESAGQSVFWPHVHFIPRKKGDQEPGPKGIRIIYPNDPFHPKNKNA